MAKKVEKKPTRKAVKKPSGCYFTETNTVPNYKDVLVLKRFLTERGKVLPASVSGISSRYQRVLSREIKKARYMALLPYTDRHAL